MKLHSTVCEQTKKPYEQTQVISEDGMPQQEECPYSQLSLPVHVVPNEG